MSKIAPGFLVAAPVLRDPNFAGTVVLMVDHNEEGALGFVVNRPASASLGDVLDYLGMGEEDASSEVPVMVGGPVSPHTGWVVFESPPELETGGDVLVVTPGLAVSASKRVLREAAQCELDGRSMLVQGYAGWGPGQLEGELREGVWIPVDLDERVLFDTEPGGRWSAALAVLGIHPGSIAGGSVAEA